MQLARSRPRRLAVLVVLAVALACEILVGGPGARADTTPSVTWAASAARPFSDPDWLPVRDPAVFTCVHSNCPGPYHGFWAMDVIGQLGDPIYAAGAGVFHIGAVDAACRPSGSEVGGTWVWIDHGGGIVSKYAHLDTITAAEGQLVTPSTRIGTMGHSGDVLPCTTNYLHFEVRTGGIGGTRVDPGPLYACEGTARRTYPAALGLTSWNHLPSSGRTTPQLGNGCLPTSTGTSGVPTAVTTSRADALARVAWQPPASGAGAVTGYVVSHQVWHPSINAWHTPAYRTVTAGQRSLDFGGLVNGARYRYRVLARTAIGNSAWSPYVEAVPAAPPIAPGTDRVLTAGRTYIRFGWWNGTPRGVPITSYTVAIRQRTASGWTAWRYTSVAADVRSHRWDELRSGTTYQMSVRANSSAGSSWWGTFRSLTTTA
jgi:hypothetical protein